jgi:hypothetical protein
MKHSKLGWLNYIIAERLIVKNNKNHLSSQEFICGLLSDEQ